MKKLVTVLCLTFTVSLYSQMNGNYTIGGASPDFSTIQQAIDNLMSNGVNGPATFLIRDGVYNEQLNFGIIPGVNLTNRVVFQSESEDSTAVEINYAASGFSDNWVIQFDSTEYVTLQWLKVRTTGVTSSTTVIEIKSQSNYVHINNCFIEGNSFSNSPLIYAAQGSYYQYVEIKRNYLFQGGVAINMRNDGGASLPNGQGVLVEDNDFVDNGYGAITMINHDYFEIKNNRVSNPVVVNLSGYDAFYFSNVLKGGVISGNKIVVSGRDGITINNCKNTVSAKGRMNNNFISVTGTAAGYGLSILGSPVVSSSKTSYWDVYNNTVIVDKNNNNGALKVYKSENNNIVNNIFYNNNTGSAIYNNNASTIINTTIDYNVLFSMDTVIGVWNLTNYLDFSSFQTATSTNNNSISTHPQFNSITDYHLCNAAIDNKGSNTLFALTDIDGELRDTITPDIGVDEFNATIDITVSNTSPTLMANQGGASYQWLNCDNAHAIIPTETGQSYTATVNGNYAVEITVGSCVDTSACENVPGVGVSELTTQEVLVYPNPTSGIITIDLGENTHLVEYSVTTLEGRIVEQGRTTDNKIVVNLSEERSGIYFLKLGNKVYKVMKQ